MSDELDELRVAARGAQIITDPDLMDAYRRDQTPAVVPGQPRCVLLATGTGQVAAALAWAQRYRVPVVPG
jgi:glycolate oxidase